MSYTASSTLGEAYIAPRARRKAPRILAAAGRVFRQHGYAATSMDEVAREAEVSKATLYAYFFGKHELFAAVIREESDRYSGALLEAPDGPEGLQSMLLRFGRAILALLLAEETVTSYRMVVAEAARLPELGRLYYENGAARLLTSLEQAFGTAMASGRLRTENPRRAAEQFIGLVRGDLMLRALLCVDPGASAAEQDLIVRSGVETFYRAFRPDTAGALS